MIDREKVIKGLEHCISDEHQCEDCPYKQKCIREGWIVALQKDVLELLKEQPQWISVKDRLPEQSGYVLTCYGKFHTINVFSYSKKHRAFNAYDCLPTAKDRVNVTHWMSVPEPPGVKEVTEWK